VKRLSAVRSAGVSWEGNISTSKNSTSTGHEASDASWLDLHFESSRPEYEDALAHVGMQHGWDVLDAGCGGGSFLPLICKLTGSNGSVAALDLAPENIQRAESLIKDVPDRPKVRTRVGSILSLPFNHASFDCVWSANVMQYLTPAEFQQATDEVKRVLKPGGIFAVKDFDSTLLQILPMDRGVFTRFMTARLQTFRAKGVLGTDCGSSLPGLLRDAGMEIVWRKGWLVERWAPIGEHTRNYVRDLISYFTTAAPDYDLPESDRHYWKELAANPKSLLDQPDFCYREFFVLTVCRNAAI
jgi:arsenite methyltransferase